MKEIWKDIENWEGYYQVSNLGKVRSVDRLVNSRNNGKNFRKGIILKQHLTHKGYIKVMLNMKSKSYNRVIHRLVAINFIPNPKNLPEVNHKNGNKLSNNVSNLEWCTSSYNQIHAYKLGLKDKKGTNHNHSRLTDDDIIKIREMHKDGYQGKFIAGIFKIGESQTSAIINRKSWSHIK